MPRGTWDNDGLETGIVGLAGLRGCWAHRRGIQRVHARVVQEEVREAARLVRVHGPRRVALRPSGDGAWIVRARQEDKALGVDAARGGLRAEIVFWASFRPLFLLPWPTARS